MTNKTLIVNTYYLKNGDPTCSLCAGSMECEFLGSRCMGTVPVCMLGEQVDVCRSGKGDGFIRPHMKCRLHYDAITEPIRSDTPCSIRTIPSPVHQLVGRINNYLSNGGLFNPEMMEHEKARDLLIDIRDHMQNTITKGLNHEK